MPTKAKIKSISQQEAKGAWLKLLAFPLIALSLALAACAEDDNGGDADETKEDYQGRVEREVSEIGDQMSDLEARADEATGDGRQEIDKQIDQLKSDRGDIEEKLRDLRAAGKNEWQQINLEIDSALSDLERNLKQALSDMSGS